MLYYRILYDKVFFTRYMIASKYHSVVFAVGYFHNEPLSKRSDPEESIKNRTQQLNDPNPTVSVYKKFSAGPSRSYHSKRTHL